MKPALQSNTKTPRKQSAYNLFMSETLIKLKNENPQMTHKERFKKAASMWSTSKAS